MLARIDVAPRNTNTEGRWLDRLAFLSRARDKDSVRTLRAGIRGACMRVF
jgi:hypothetical protein